MQTLGLAGSESRSESRWRTLFWPTIRNAEDVDYVSQQGFWICIIIAGFTVIMSLILGIISVGIWDALFFFLGAFGVRERSQSATLGALLVYLLGTFLLGSQLFSGASIIRLVFLAVLVANVRGNWLANRWSKASGPLQPAERLNETLIDQFSGRLPAILWPKLRYVFFVFLALEILGLGSLIFRQIQ
ncbi:MAG: hypothetical protein NTV70_02650 [Acidobacteria bacterium]|nr:hypothetical protein [Acidobacteriota bacterium]